MKLTLVDTTDLSDAADKQLANALRIIDEHFNINLLFYPGSGWHNVPVRVIGDQRTVHLSERETPYFDTLKRGYRVYANYQTNQLPIADEVFDATLIWGAPLYEGSLNEFARVTKKGGHLIFGYHYSPITPDLYDPVCFTLDRELNKVNLGGVFERIRIYENDPSKLKSKPDAYLSSTLDVLTVSNEDEKKRSLWLRLAQGLPGIDPF